MDQLRPFILIGSAIVMIGLNALLFLVIWLGARRGKRAFYKLCAEGGIAFAPPEKSKCVFGEGIVNVRPRGGHGDISIEYCAMIEEVLAWEVAHMDCAPSTRRVNALDWAVYRREESGGMTAFLRLEEHYIAVYSEMPPGVQPEQILSMFAREEGCGCEPK